MFELNQRWSCETLMDWIRSHSTISGAMGLIMVSIAPTIFCMSIIGVDLWKEKTDMTDRSRFFTRLCLVGFTFPRKRLWAKLADRPKIKKINYIYFRTLTLIVPLSRLSPPLSHSSTISLILLDTSFAASHPSLSLTLPRGRLLPL